MKYQGGQQEEESSFKPQKIISVTSNNHFGRQCTPDSLMLENGNHTISSGYESSECGSTSNAVLQSDKNVIEIECNHNTVLTEENLSRVSEVGCDCISTLFCIFNGLSLSQFMQQVDQIRMDSSSDKLSESYSNSLMEMKNHNLRSSDSDNLSFGTVSSCADLTYSDDDGEF